MMILYISIFKGKNNEDSELVGGKLQRIIDKAYNLVELEIEQ